MQSRQWRIRPLQHNVVLYWTLGQSFLSNSLAVNQTCRKYKTNLLCSAEMFVWTEILKCSLLVQLKKVALVMLTNKFVEAAYYSGVFKKDWILD